MRSGKISQLESVLPRRLKGKAGIGHTRWATHGEPNDDNAHPHVSMRMGVLPSCITVSSKTRRRCARVSKRMAVHFVSETDSEVLAHLIASIDADTLIERVRLALGEIEGTYGLAVVDAQAPGQIVAARNGSPVVLGIGDKEMMVASDVAAFVRHTQQVIYLDDGDIAEISASGYRVIDRQAATAHRQPTAIDWSAETYDKGDYSHFTLKEIYEQPEAIARTIKGRLDNRFQTAHLGGLNLEAREILAYRRIRILGCGSAGIAGFIGARSIEQLARIPCDAEAASEFRYRNPVIEPDTLYIAVSQSGETYDTLAAVQEIKRKGGRVLGVVNVVGSSIARACDGGIYLHAGPEIAVVSTKTFISTLVAFVLLGLHLGRMKDLSIAEGRALIEALESLPGLVSNILQEENTVEAIARKYSEIENVYFVGRNLGFGVATEAALKLKEISYIHAEAYAASELKHGPLALISPETPTVFVLPDDELFEKNLSTIEEIRARKGPLLVVTDAHGESLVRVRKLVDDCIVVPRAGGLLTPVTMLLPLQLLAYHIALARDCDVDQPRNLAKSVTVE